MKKPGTGREGEKGPASTRGHCFAFTSLPLRGGRRRHRRKFAEGELGEDKRFYFHGPDGRLELRAQNLPAPTA
jgi:hypothetical protein